MRLTTWNVNGIRNPFSYAPWNQARTFSAMFDILGSDIVVMQELKIQRKDLRDDMVLVDGWDCYFSLPKHKKGYSGVGIYTRNATCAPIRAEEGLLGVLPSPSGVPYCDLPEQDHIGGYPGPLQVAQLGVDAAALDAEGRCVVVEFPAFVLFGVYSPANSNGLRDDFRYGFICALDCRIRNLVRSGKNVILVGDLNVTRHEIDSAPTLEELRKSQTTREEYLSSPNRRVFNQLLIGGEVIGERDEGRENGVLWDTTRAFHPDRKGMYTHWETKINARPGNYGGRIDFILVSRSIQSWITDANIQEGLLGSDHCPVFVDFADDITIGDRSTPLPTVMNPPGYFKDGQRMLQWKIGDTPAFSAKRMPEFDKRRSIKSMFAAPTQMKPKTEEEDGNMEANSESNSDNKNTATCISSSDGNVTKFPEQVSPSQESECGTKKRKSSAPKEVPTKRPKPDVKNIALSRGQQSLKGFFSAKTSQTSGEVEQARAQSVSHPPATETRVRQVTPGYTSPTNTRSTPASIQKTAVESRSPSPSEVASQLASAEQSQRSWGALFSKPIAPLCESHSEPCKTMLTKKKGTNQGRSFWMCARPLGPSGDKERGTQWRCPTFIWCSDWPPKKDAAQSPVRSCVS